MDDIKYEDCIKHIEELEKRVDALLVIEKQNADMRAALEYWLAEFGTFALPEGHKDVTWEDVAIRKSNKALGKEGE